MTRPGTNYLLLLEAIKTVGLCAHDLEKTHRNIPELVEHKECVGKAVTVCLYLIDMMKSKVPPEQQTKIDRVAATFDLSPKMKMLSNKEISDIRKQFCTRQLRDYMIEELLDENKNLRKSLASLKNDNSSLLELEKEEREWLRERMGNLENNIQWMKINIDKVQFDTNKVIENYEESTKYFKNALDNFIKKFEFEPVDNRVTSVSQIEADPVRLEHVCTLSDPMAAEEKRANIQMRGQIGMLKEIASDYNETISNLLMENKAMCDFKEEIAQYLGLESSFENAEYEYIEASIAVVQADLVSLNHIIVQLPFTGTEQNIKERRMLEEYISWGYRQLQLLKKKVEVLRKERFNSSVQTFNNILNTLKHKLLEKETIELLAKKLQKQIDDISDGVKAEYTIESIKNLQEQIEELKNNIQTEYPIDIFENLKKQISELRNSIENEYPLDLIKGLQEQILELKINISAEYPIELIEDLQKQIVKLKDNINTQYPAELIQNLEEQIVKRNKTIDRELNLLNQLKIENAELKKRLTRNLIPLEDNTNSKNQLKECQKSLNFQKYVCACLKAVIALLIGSSINSNKCL